MKIYLYLCSRIVQLTHKLVHIMKSKVLLLSFIVLCGVVNAQNAESDGTYSDSKYGAKYRRSSIAMFTILHPADSFSTEIRQAVEAMPFPDKYDNHSLDFSFINGTPNADRKADLQSELDNFMQTNQVAKQLVGEWFNFQGTGFDMSKIQERGLYDASMQDLQDALATERGKAMLADAGEELIGKTFVLVNDISYVDHEERAKVVVEGSRAVGATAEAVGNAAGEVLGMFGGIGAAIGGIVQTTGSLVNSAADLVGSLTDMLDISGFVVRINSYLYQLEWNDSIANTFYSEYYTEGDSAKIAAFVADEQLFKMKYVGKYEQYTDKGTMYSLKNQEEQMLVVCARTLDKNIVNLQKKYPVFQVKTPIADIAYNEKGKPVGYKAYIGTKEGITPKSKLTVLERVIDKDGVATFKKVGDLRPDKGHIWDNRYMVSDEEAVGGEVEYTLLKGTKNLMPGMLLFEGKFDAKEEAERVKSIKEARAAAEGKN